MRQHSFVRRVAYFCTRAVCACGETPHQRCYNAPFLGASKCPYKGGFARGTGRVAYLAYVSGLGRARNALRLVLSRPVCVAYLCTRAVWAYRETPLGKCFHAPYAPSKTTCERDTPRGLACPRRGRTTPSLSAVSHGRVCRTFCKSGLSPSPRKPYR